MKKGYVCLLALAGLAGAQNTISYVSTSGNDINSCSLAAPCRTFAAAVSLTNSGGIVQAINAGDFGPVTLSKTITIDGGSGGVIVATSAKINGVTTNLPAFAQVTLRNLLIKPYGTGANSPSGVLSSNSGAATVNLDNVSVVCDTNSGTTGVTANEAFASRLHLRDVRVAGCGSGISGTGLSSAVPVITAEHVSIMNGGYGISNTDMSLTLRDSVVTDMSNTGISSAASTYGASTLIERSEISYNGTGLITFSVGLPVTIRFGDCVITGNGTSLQTVGGQIISYRTNMINGNVLDASPVSSTSLK